MLILTPENDRDITLAELEELADDIRQALKSAQEELEVTVSSHEEPGAGLSWDQVIQVLLPLLPDANSLSNAAVGIALERVIAWMYRYFKKGGPEVGRRRIVRVYGADHTLLRTYVLESSDTDPLVLDGDDENDGA